MINNLLVRDLLTEGMPLLWQRINKDRLAKLEHGFCQWEIAQQPCPQKVKLIDWMAEKLSEYLSQHIRNTLQHIEQLSFYRGEFTRAFNHAATEQERQHYILDMAEKLGADPQKLKGDRKALSRWFGYEAILDRYHHRLAEQETSIVFNLDRLDMTIARTMRSVDSAKQKEDMWQRLALESVTRSLFNYVGDTRVRIAAFHCMSVGLRELKPANAMNNIDVSTLQFIYRSALDHEQEVWIQCEALLLLRYISSGHLRTALEKRLKNNREGDDIFVRRRALKYLIDIIKEIPETALLVELVLNDPSPYVRQGLAEFIFKLDEPLRSVCMKRMLHDSDRAVRAAAVLSIKVSVGDALPIRKAQSMLSDIFQEEIDTYVLHTALDVSDSVHEILSKRNVEDALSWAKALGPYIERLQDNEDHPSINERAAEITQRMWLRCSAQASLLNKRLSLLLQEGGKKTINLDNEKESHDLLGRILSIRAQNDLGFDGEVRDDKMRIHQGDRFRFRLWRLLYEFRKPATDKRQGFRHTVGRIYSGTVRARSAKMAEAAETRVPGEPLYYPNEDSVRPYLPLVDEIISSLDQDNDVKPVKFYSSYGITEVTPPQSLQERIFMRAKLVFKFDHYARLRNWTEHSHHQANGYIVALTDLGFDINFAPYETVFLDKNSAGKKKHVMKFFPALLPLPLGDLWSRISNYVSSLYENSIIELVLFLIVAFALFSVRHLYTSLRIRQARKYLPLVIGGWGTRGKSGVERMKAALFNALGYNVFSKTTGCEAMFLHAYPHGPLRELFLFRPYDKATIWEHANVMQIAKSLSVDVFLWECMGLTPEYVKILQKQWSRDDLSTITNTYPDHEDLQGPAGINVAQTMVNFIPDQGILLTTEEQMLPVLKEGASKVSAKVYEVGWQEAGLLTGDVLSRFPYEEHPYNVALILLLARKLGVEEDYALKEIADRIVPDIGVLKSFPVSEVFGRRLDFVNGMSANERVGCLGNWERMGFDNYDYDVDIDTWISALVNNRADRIARSRVFADLIVRDLKADHYYLVGSNIEGLLGYIEKSWKTYAKELVLWEEGDNENNNALKLFDEESRQLRVPMSTKTVMNKFKCMLKSLGSDIDESKLISLMNDETALRAYLLRHRGESYLESFVEHLQIMRKGYQAYLKLRNRISECEIEDRAQIMIDYKVFLWVWFSKKLLPIEQEDIHGEDVIRFIAEKTPPGYHNRIMGLQNIKGIGLDFVYRWLAWERCHGLCNAIQNNDYSVMERALTNLASFEDHGLLTETYTRESLINVREHPMAQTEHYQAELNVIESNLGVSVQRITNTKENRKIKNNIWRRLLVILESFLDAGDAIKRRKTANRIYRDLTEERISHARAALELKNLNQRQQGGWLVRELG